MGNYYCLIAGLPELQLDDQKLKLSLADFKQELIENLSVSDLQLINYFFMQFDNSNLLSILANKEVDNFNSMGVLEKEDILEIISQFKESDSPNNRMIYRYYYDFIPAYLQNEALFPHMSWADQLSTLYFDYAQNSKNSFISSWFTFNLNLVNLQIAVNCRKYGLNREEYIIGTNEVAEAIRTSNARDFGITPYFPEVEEILRIAEEPSIYEKERYFDQLRWNWLEENGFFHYFDVEHLFIYLLKLEMLQRWISLEKETGTTIFREMISTMQQSFEFPNEFTVKRVK
jgi:hypothetical protein